MKYPSLVPSAVCKTTVKIHLSDGINEMGEPKQVFSANLICNYSEEQKQILDAERQLIILNATALFPGDIAPGIELSGTVEVEGKERRIYRGRRARNPDGSVNYIELDLM